MALPALRDALGEGGFVLSAWSSLTDPNVHDALLRAPFDALCLDMQHGMHDVASMAAAVGRAALLGKPALVRLPIEDRANAARALDLGASAVIMPMIETEADARAFVAAVKYAPLGCRSFGPTRAVELHGYARAAGYGAQTGYTTDANRETLAFAMIETAAAVDNLAAILALDGLDGVFVGPSDLSIALSPTGTWDPNGTVADAAIRQIALAARSAGKFAGIYAAGAEQVRRYRSYGYTLATVSDDFSLFKSAAVALAEDCRS